MDRLFSYTSSYKLQDPGWKFRIRIQKKGPEPIGYVSATLIGSLNDLGSDVDPDPKLFAGQVPYPDPKINFRSRSGFWSEMRSGTKQVFFPTENYIR